MDRKVEISIIALTQARNYEGFYHLLMEDTVEYRRFSITIGRSEAESIAMGLEGVPVPRPLTHDVFKQLLTKLDIKLTEVIIHKVDEKDMICHAHIYLQNKLDILELDARPSDAIALAIKCNAPVYTYESVITTITAAIADSEYGFTKADKKNVPLHRLSLEDLHKRLKEAVEKEAYEEAIKLRDEIISRQASTEK